MHENIGGDQRFQNDLFPVRPLSLYPVERTIILDVLVVERFYYLFFPSGPGVHSQPMFLTMHKAVLIN
jgi:hypothetical protein